MNHKPLHPLKPQERKIVLVNQQQPRQLKVLQSTAIHSKETKRRTTTSTIQIFYDADTKKQGQLFSHSQLSDNEHKIPYAKQLMEYLKSIESEFLTPNNCEELTMFSLCRLRFICRLRKVKDTFNLIEETIFLAIHLYDKYFRLEEITMHKLSKMKFERGSFDITRCLRNDGNLIRLVY